MFTVAARSMSRTSAVIFASPENVSVPDPITYTLS